MAIYTPIPMPPMGLIPTQLIETAAQFGLKSIAITDHDSVSGVEEGIKVGKIRIEVIPGIELSLDYPGIPGSIHL